MTRIDRFYDSELVCNEHRRANPLAVRIGHELPEIERVVRRQPVYLVIEKEDPAAEEVAVETDPRS
jgi:hypothetical protein